MISALPADWVLDPPFTIERAVLFVVGSVVVTAVIVAVGIVMTRPTAADEAREQRTQKAREALLDADRKQAELNTRRAEADAGRIFDVTTELR